MLSVIQNRRSIRRYKDTPVPRELIEEIIQAGILAPSAKNRQPWHFVVAAGEEKKSALTAMKQGLEREKASPVLPGDRDNINGAEHTLSIMEQAPAVIFVVNTQGFDIRSSMAPEERVADLCNVQSIGAAVENMILTAEGLGLGSLWIGHTYMAYDELNQWLNTEGELLAALALGYADEEPYARPRRSLAEVVDWRV